MSDAQQHEPSLSEAIRRRQQANRAAKSSHATQESYASRVARGRPSASPSTRPAAPRTAERLATQTMELVGGEPRWSHSQQRTALLGVALAAFLCLAGAVIVFRYTPSWVTPTPRPLPTASARELVGYFQTAGMPLLVLPRSASSALWSAREAVEFELSDGGTGQIIVLSYDSPALAGIDAFKASNEGRFHAWRLIQLSNVLLLISPETSPDLEAEIASHLTRYVIAPYQGFVPTATP